MAVSAIHPLLNAMVPTLRWCILFITNQSYTLTIQNVEDASGNMMLTQPLPFIYVELGEAAYRDVVFNEILADPSPTVQLPDAEFIDST